MKEKKERTKRAEKKSVTAEKLKLKAERLAVTAEEKESVRRKLVMTAENLATKAKQLAATAKEKESIKHKLEITAKSLATLAKEKENVRNRLVVTARALKFKAKNLAATAKEKESKRRTLVVTALKYAESIIATLREPFLVLDKNFRIISTNQSFYKTFKTTKEETIGQLLPDLGNRQWSIPKLLHLLKEILPEKMVVTDYEVEHEFEDIGLHIMQLNARKLRVSKEELILLSIEDVTQERGIEKAKTEFVSLTTHQLRTPLGSMRWNLELLESEVESLPEASQKRIHEVYQSNLRMIRILNDLLNIARIDQGRIKDEPISTEIVGIIKSALKEMEPEANKRSVSIKMKIKKSDLPNIIIDPNRFREVIQNLLSNAVRYTLSGGQVLVEIDYTENSVEISVSDTGIGIPEKEKSKIYSKFFRAKNALKIDTEGSGLGLYIVKSYVDKWGGKIWFESQEGKGATFFISLPLISKSANGNI